MLRMGKLTDYGIVLMVEMTSRPEHLHKAAELSEQLQLPQPTVSKLLQRLSLGGFLESTRGVNGGYCLARSASEITVADIILSLEGQSGLTECVEHPGSCSQEDTCTIRGKWPAINAAIWHALTGITLVDMAQGSDVRMVNFMLPADGRKLPLGANQG
jgi:FeS assembly SUF system regulator